MTRTPLYPVRGAAQDARPSFSSVWFTHYVEKTPAMSVNTLGVACCHWRPAQTLLRRLRIPLQWNSTPRALFHSKIAAALRCPPDKSGVYFPIGCDYFHVSQISELAFSDLFEWPKSLFYGVIFGRISLMAERIRAFIRGPQQTLKADLASAFFSPVFGQYSLFSIGLSRQCKRFRRKSVSRTLLKHPRDNT